MEPIRCLDVKLFVDNVSLLLNTSFTKVLNFNLFKIIDHSKVGFPNIFYSVFEFLRDSYWVFFVY
jgi:hypothetical protein